MEILEYINSGKVDEAYILLEEKKRLLSPEDYIFYKALIHHLKNNINEAKNLYLELLAINPINSAAIINLSTIYNAESNHVEAEILLNRIHGNNSINFLIADFDTQFGLGNFIRCKKIFERLSPLNKGEVKYLEREAALILESGDPIVAIEKYKKILELRPDSHQAISNLGVAKLKVGESDEAENFARMALMKMPNNWKYKVNLANALIANNKIGEAEQVIESIEGPGQRNVLTLTTLSRINIYKQNYDIAIEIANVVLDLDSTNSRAITCLADSYSALGDTEKSKKYYEDAILFDANSTLAKWHYAFHLLRNEDFKKGWELYKIGFQRPKDGRGEYKFNPEFEWNPSVKCRNLIVWGEQGIGDQLMFSKFLRYIPNSITNIEVKIDDRLVDLFQDGTSIRQGIKYIKNYPNEFQHHIPIGNLPALFWDEYISDPKGMEAFLRIPKSKGAKVRIGISWRGGINERMQLKRSLPVKFFQSIKSLHTNDIQIIILQYNAIADEINFLKNIFPGKISIPKYDAKIEVNLWAQHINSCDLIISVDNSTVHFAGALGVPTLAILPTHPDFRWGKKGKRNYWYETVELLRDFSVMTTENLTSTVDTWIKKKIQSI